MPLFLYQAQEVGERHAGAGQRQSTIGLLEPREQVLDLTAASLQLGDEISKRPSAPLGNAAGILPIGIDLKQTGREWMAVYHCSQQMLQELVVATADMGEDIAL